MSRNNGEFVPTERELKEERERQEYQAKEDAEFNELFAANREWLEADQRHGYVYFLSAGDHMKIGWARDVRERMKFVQTGNAHDVDLMTVIVDERAQNLERILHFFFREHHVKGEWYDYWISAEDREKIASAFEQWAKEVADTIRNNL